MLKEEAGVAVHKQESLQEWTTFPLSCSRIDARQQYNSPDSDMPEDLGDEGMAEGVDTIVHHTFTEERKPAAVPELPNNKPHQSPMQSHAEDHTEQIEATSVQKRSLLKNRQA